MNKTIFFYDGNCAFCSNVAKHYSQVEGHEKVLFIDIESELVFRKYGKGLKHQDVKKAIHARLPDGTTKIGVDALITLWRVFPNYHFLATIFDHRLTKPFAQIFYRIIAKNRKLISKLF